MRTLVASLSLLVAIAPIAIADARQCDSLVLSDDAEDVVLGEVIGVRCFTTWGTSTPPFRFCVFFPPLTRRLGVCWRGSDRVWHYKQTACTVSSTRDDYFQLETKGGDDRVAVLKPEHTEHTEHTDYMPCGRVGRQAIAPWFPGFGFSIHASLGTGSDLFHGSPNGDGTHQRHDDPHRGCLAF
ncbi:MAG TPA: hypothetical protein VF179_28875 [Thermoanaerobaculia bacterium]|nr:hypothetical protein [Thermoanaerobaculia bacterium]